MLDAIAQAPTTQIPTTPEPSGPSIPEPRKLARDLQAHYQRLEPLRQIAAANMEEYHGQHYPGAKVKLQRPANVIYESIQAIRPSLAAEEIEPTVRPRIATKDLDAQVLKQRLSQVIDEQQVPDQINRAVDDAMFAGLGAILVMQAPGESVVDLDAQEFRLGQTVVRAINIDDLVLDGDARTPHEMRIIGDKRRISRRHAIVTRMYGRDPGEEGSQWCMTRDEAEAFLAKQPSIAETKDRERDGDDDPQYQETSKDIIEVWELVVWCDDGPWRIVVPHTHVTESHGGMDIGSKYLVCEPYDGPEETGYCLLDMIAIRGEVIGLAYASSVRDLHDASVKMSNKLVQGMLSYKRQGVYEGGAEDEAQVLAKSPIANMVRLSNFKSVTSMEIGGIGKEAYAGLDWLSQQTQKAAGNTALLAGSGSIADTATESSILNSGAQARVGEFFRKVMLLTKKVMRKIAWYEYFNPLARWNVQLMMGGAPMQVEYGAELREGDQLDAFFDIGANIVSVAQTDPAIRQQQVVQYLDLVMRYMPMVEAGLLSWEGMLMMGRQEFGIKNVDQMFPDPARIQAMMQEMQMQAGPPTQPGMRPGRSSGQPPGQGRERRPGGQGAMTANVQSAYAPAFA